MSRHLPTVSTRETATEYILKLAKALKERKVPIQLATANKVTFSDQQQLFDILKI